MANSYRSTQAVLNQGIRNANDGLSTLQIKDGAMNNICTLLDRLSTLATQSASAASTATATTLNNEFQDDRDGNRPRSERGRPRRRRPGFSVFVSNDGANGMVGGTIGAADATGARASPASSSTRLPTRRRPSTRSRPRSSTLGTAQGTVGTLENRLQFAVGLAQSQVVNTKAAESRIRDANVAEESANMTRYTILTQSGIAALAQANQSSAGPVAPAVSRPRLARHPA